MRFCFGSVAAVVGRDDARRSLGTLGGRSIPSVRRRICDVAAAVDVRFLVITEIDFTNSGHAVAVRRLGSCGVAGGVVPLFHCPFLTAMDRVVAATQSDASGRR